MEKIEDLKQEKIIINTIIETNLTNKKKYEEFEKLGYIKVELKNIKLLKNAIQVKNIKRVKVGLETLKDNKYLIIGAGVNVAYLKIIE